MIDRRDIAPESDSLIGLPDAHRAGLIGVSVLAALSFISSTTLFVHLTIKLVRWYVRSNRIRRHAKQEHASRRRGVDLNLGLAQRHFGHGKRGHSLQQQDAASIRELGAEEASTPVPKAEPNQFVVLIYNLFLADMHQACAFLFNAVWVGRDAVVVGSGSCWLQGFFVSTGDLAASLFITFIAIHTYCVIVRGTKPPQWVVITGCVSIWAFTYLMVIVGVFGTNHGAGVGGFYVRAAAWCWINVKFDTYRLLTHYLFIFISLAVTSILYTLIFINLRRRGREAATPAVSVLPSARPSKSSIDIHTTPDPPPETTTNHAKTGGHHPTFLVYPLIYVFCTSPLALGRVATMAGAKVSINYFCIAAALITSNGWLDVLLWSMTRRTLIFGKIDATDLESFTFMRTPSDRRFGNMVWVEGAGKSATAGARAGGAGTTDAPPESGFWERLFRGPSGWRELGRPAAAPGDSIGGRMRRRGERSISQESLRSAARADMGMAIQMDMVTSVVVEDATDEEARNGLRLPDESRSRQPSVYTEPDYNKMELPPLPCEKQ